MFCDKRPPIVTVLFLLSAVFVLSAFTESQDFNERGSFVKRLEDGKSTRRIYSVYTPHLDWNKMQKYARSKPWDGKGSVTHVYFFDDWRNTPDVTFTGENFSDFYKEHWVGGYYHHDDGGELFVEYPARKRSFSYGG